MKQPTTVTPQLDWATDVQPYLHTLQPVAGGFTKAKPGIVTLRDGSRVFVKLSHDDQTHAWLRKEIKVYRLLNGTDYAYIPTLLAWAPDGAGMAIEYMLGASFEAVWDADKLAAVTEAQVALRQYKQLFTDDADFDLEHVVSFVNRWPKLVEKDNLGTLNTRLAVLTKNVRIPRSLAMQYAAELDDWRPRRDTLVHQDIRADNFGYDSTHKQGKLIDWNWLCIGDQWLDRTPLLVSMYRTGFNPYKQHPDYMDRPSLIYILGYWMSSILLASAQMSDHERTLRENQAESIRTCLELLS